MPTVTATWSARMPDCAEREQLIAEMSQMADAYAAWFRRSGSSEAPRVSREPPEARGTPDEAIADLRSAEGHPRRRDTHDPYVRHRSEQISGRILLDPSLFGAEEDRALRSARDAGMKLVRRPMYDGNTQAMIVLENARLRGVAFHLWDPREMLFALGGRVSWVFLDAPELDCLDGWVVAAPEGPAERAPRPGQLADSSVPSEANWLLGPPSVDLRYFYEGFVRFMCAVVKYFYIPDLDYWVWEDNPMWAEYQERLSEAVREFGVAEARRRAFEELGEILDFNAAELVKLMARP